MKSESGVKKGRSQSHSRCTDDISHNISLCKKSLDLKGEKANPPQSISWYTYYKRASELQKFLFREAVAEGAFVIREKN